MRSYTALAEPDAVWLISDTCLGPTNLFCLCQQSSINWLNSLSFICSLSFNNININIDVTEAPFMVKFEITIFFFFKHSRNNPWGKYLKLSQTFNSTLFLPSSNEELCILSPKKCIWNIWMLIKWGAHLKNISEIFGGGKNERQSRGISNRHFQWTLTYSAICFET